MDVDRNGFRYRRRVQFAETDLAGIVHFSQYFRYMEEAEHALWRAAGLTIERAGSDTGWPRVAAAFDYKQSLRFEDEFDVRVRIATVTRRTIKYSFTLLRGETVVGTGTVTSVHVSKLPGQPMTAVPVPGDLIARLQAVVDAGG
jgi:acyl-CoA thioester hydrolase